MGTRSNEPGRAGGTSPATEECIDGNLSAFIGIEVHTDPGPVVISFEAFGDRAVLSTLNLMDVDQRVHGVSFDLAGPDADVAGETVGGVRFYADRGTRGTTGIAEPS